MIQFPERIVCLTEETTEVLYILGEGDRVVGVSGYTVRPPEARSKPKVCSFVRAQFDKILALEPDLVLGFSDLQADIAAELIRRGVPVLVFNQRRVREILQMILVVGGIVGAAAKAQAYVKELERGLEQASREAESLPRRPRVYFEEWMDPLISGICWVEELVRIAGGDPVFPELGQRPLAKDRIVSPDEVRQRNPDLILASWCGRKVMLEQITGRPGWNAISAVRNGHVYEIKSNDILQPGPAALTEGLRQIQRYVRAAAV